MKTNFLAICFTGLLGASLPLAAAVPWEFSDDTRYMALGDSLSAGYGAQPVTAGFVYRLYQRGVFDTTPNMLFSNVGVPGATSEDLLLHQVPLATRFQPHVITITVGGNDLLAILAGVDPNIVLAQFQINLAAILESLRTQLPTCEIIVGNLYTVSEIPRADEVVPLFNQIVAGVAEAFDARVADVFSAFEGRNGLLLINRHGAGQFEVHPTNAGYRVIADAFADAYFGE
jgi:lysophospholipase L1-like esterase